MGTYRRITAERIRKWLIERKLILPLVVGIFAFLIANGDVLVTGYSGDMTCGGSIPCYSELNFTMIKDYIYIYPNDTWHFSTDIELERIEMQVRDRRYKTGWRTIDLTQRSPYCQRTGCKYSYRFYRSKGLWEIRFVGYKKNAFEDVKWSFGPSIDPVWKGVQIDFELIENTDECLRDCYLRFKFKINKTLAVSKLSDFKGKFIKATGAMDLQDSGFRKGVNVSYNESMWISNILCNPFNETTPNGTVENSNCTDYGYYNITEKIKFLYKDFNPLGKTIQANKWYHIELWGKKRIKFGENSIDAVPSLWGYDLPFAWWNNSWGKKQPIEIFVASGATEQDYQVKLVINSANNGTNWNWTNECVDSNSSKARFVNGSEDTELAFWVESCSISGQNMTVWVEVDQNISTANYTFYVYYDNEDATATVGIHANNISATFVIGDDFDDGSYSEWTITNDETVTESGTEITMTKTGTGKFDYAGVADLALRVTKTVMTNNWTVDLETDYSGTIQAGSHPGIVIREDSNNYIYFTRDGASDNNIINYANGGTPATNATGSAAGVEYHRLQKRGNTYYAYYSGGDGVWTLVSATTMTTFASPTIIGLILNSNHAGASTFKSDVIKVYKWHDPEPSYGIGAEETLSVSLAVTLNSPVDNYNSSTETVSFNCSTDGTTINITLYHNGSGWHANETNTSGFEGTYIFSKTFTDNSYLWNCYGCNSSACVFADANRTVNVNETLAALYLNGSDTDLFYELGMTANITSYAAGNVCISIDDHPEYQNVACAVGNVSYQFATTGLRWKFNDSTTAKNLTANGTFHIPLDKYVELLNGTINATGFNSSDIYPKNVRIDIGNDGFYDIELLGTINGTVGYIDELSDGNTTKNYTWANPAGTVGGVKIAYVTTPANITVTKAEVNATPYRMDAADDNYSFDLPAEITYITGMWTENGSMFYAANAMQDSNIYQFNETGGLVATHDLSANCTAGTGSVWSNGTYFWVGCAPTAGPVAPIMQYDSGFTFLNNYDMYLHSDYLYPFGLTSPDNGVTFLILDRRYPTTRMRLGRFNKTFGLLDNCKLNDSLNNFWYDVHAWGGYAWVSTYDRPMQRFLLSDILACDAGETEIYPDNTFYNVRGLDGGDAESSRCWSSAVTGNATHIWCGSGVYDIIYRFTKDYPTDVTVDTGGNGEYDYEGSGEMTTETLIDLNITAMQNYIDEECTGTTCDVPLYIGSKTVGLINIDNIDIQYTFNPIAFNLTAIYDWLDSQGGTTNLNVTFNVTAEWGTVQFDDIDIEFKGSARYNVTSNSTYHWLYVRWSNFSVAIPDSVWFSVFAPRNVSQYNVSPFGQSDTVPSFNVTGLGYDDDSLVYLSMNQSSDSCYNLSFSNDTAVGNSTILETTRIRFLNLSYLESGDIRMWMDIVNCTNTTAWFDRNLYFDGICNSCLNPW